MTISSEPSDYRWNAGTWFLLMLVLITGTFISYYLRNFTDSLLLYLPTSLGFVMVHWFGPRVLPLAFINGYITLVLWNAPGGWERILLLTTREPLIVFASWFFCRHLGIASRGLSSTYIFSGYVLLGIVLPDVMNALYTYHYTFIGGDWEKVTLLWLSDFITAFSISVPLLHYFRPVKTTYFFKLTLRDQNAFRSNQPNALPEMVLLAVIFIALSFVISFDKYWFVYGLGATILAIRHGFQYVILINAMIFILNYILPLIELGDLVHGFKGSTQLVNVHLGMTAMFFGSALIGRVISDLHQSERELIEQKREIEAVNQQLQKTNQEMDRFVYSVSHDISAPLKSIRGLIAISRLEKEKTSEFPYLTKIEESVKKLESFTEEILDHSRASRKEIAIEPIHLPGEVNEIVENFRFLKGFDSLKFHLQFDHPEIATDRFLLKVILSNLISNAIKFRKKSDDHASQVWIRSYANGNVFIEVRDNGEGIDEKLKDKIFEMFYRASENSSGSGLGLFIAREAVERLNGKISVTSSRAEGTVFTVELPQPRA
jgi:signal transduction histidine kinase